MIKQIVVAGAGTMGAGIALSAAMAGYNVVLFDAYELALEKGRAGIQKNLDYLLTKEKISEDDKRSIEQQLRFTSDLKACVGDLVIEAIIEKLEPKIALLQLIAAQNSGETILASNTSALSITTLQKALPHPGRVAGMHFFNPAHIMKLVEVVKGEETDVQTIEQLTQLCTQLKKEAVVCKDAPGFIVNRVARHYYLEALQIAGEGKISFEQIDTATTAAGFKMGPFALMDLIGIDINLATTQSLYDAYNDAIRFKPSPLQQQKVAEHKLGKKTGEGFYNYQNSKV